MSDSAITYRAYLGLMGAPHQREREEEIEKHRADLLESARYSPDYHPDCKRNGKTQAFLLMRSQKEYSYNVVCMPGDMLYAGDLIDAFGEVFIVMEARADDTTHRTGIMHQCNHFIRWQNHRPRICESWCFVDVSGYSAYVDNNVKIQKADAQAVMYLPLNEDTIRIYPGKRLPSHIGYDQYGEKLLSAYEVTEVNPVSESHNKNDHLLMLKIVRNLDESKGGQDNLDLMICNYISGEEEELPACPVMRPLLRVGIDGRKTVRLGHTNTYRATVTDALDRDVPEATVEWRGSVPGGVTYDAEGKTLKLSAGGDSALIGETVTLYAACGEAEASLEVEVTGIV